MPDIKETLTAPLGPLPRYAWVLVIVGGYFGYKFLSGRSSSSSSTTATTVGASAGAVAPSSSDYAALTSQVSTLGNQITDLGSKISTLAPTAPVNPIKIGKVITVPVNPIPRVPDPVNPIQQIRATVDSATGQLRLATGEIYNEAAQNSPNWIDAAGNIVASRNTSTGQIRLSTGEILNEAAQKSNNYIDIVSSNAIQDLATPAAAPQFGSNTATPTPTNNAVNVASGSLQNAVQETLAAPSMPTYSNAQIPSSSLNIPATTPA